jgi:hypothetical protein
LPPLLDRRDWARLSKLRNGARIDKKAQTLAALTLPLARGKS